MDNKQNLIDGLKAFRKSLETRVRVEKFILFGSQASGAPKGDSDIDLLIVSRDFAGKKFRYRPLGFHEFWSLDYPVDFLCYTTDEFEKMRNQATIVREAVETGIEIN
jgi:predicted nucleotidyltransferase